MNRERRLMWFNRALIGLMIVLIVTGLLLGDWIHVLRNAVLL